MGPPMEMTSTPSTLTGSKAGIAKNSRRPRILLVGPHPPTKGGVTTFMLNLIASPLSASFEFVPFTTTRPPKANVIDNWGYASILRGGVRRIFLGMALTVWHLISFPFIIIRQKIDLVQIQASDYQVFWESAIYAAMAGLLRRPVLFRIGGAFDKFHGHATPLEKKMIMAALHRPQAVIVQSEFAHRYIVEAGYTGEIVVLPNWLHSFHHPDSAPPSLSQPTCLFIAGAEARRKGVEGVLAAMQALDKAGCPVNFHLIAVPPLLKERIRDMQFNGVVAVEGPVSHQRVLHLMRNTEIFLLPSHGEGFPNSLVEAMGSGMASIATPVGAIPEMAASGGVTLVPVGDAAALQAAIARLATDPALRQQMSEKAVQTVRAHYTSDAALPVLKAAYQRLIR